MSELTEKGLLSERPAPASNPTGYYYATDEGKYYKSNGETWTEISTDFQDVAPTTPINIAAGVAEDGTINPLKLNDLGSLKVHGTAIPGFNIPNFTKVELTYYEDTNNIETVTYKKYGDVVCALLISYDDPTSLSPRITSVELD